MQTADDIVRNSTVNAGMAKDVIRLSVGFKAVRNGTIGNDEDGSWMSYHYKQWGEPQVNEIIKAGEILAARNN